jgi:16S rRNA processing protein RimM
VEPGDRRLTPPPPAYLAVGRIGRAHGVGGEVRVEVMTDFPDQRFVPGRRLFVGREGDPTPRAVVVASVRDHRAALLVRFDIAPDRTAAEELTGQYVYIEGAEAAPLAPDAFYQHQLMGLAVVTATGVAVGRVVGLIETGSADVLEVLAESGQMHLVPMIAAVIAAVDLDDARITITPLPGLLD